MRLAGFVVAMADRSAALKHRLTSVEHFEYPHAEVHVRGAFVHQVHRCRNYVDRSASTCCEGTVKPGHDPSPAQP